MTVPSGRPCRTTSAPPSRAGTAARRSPASSVTANHLKQTAIRGRFIETISQQTQVRGNLTETPGVASVSIKMIRPAQLSCDSRSSFLPVNLARPRHLPLLICSIRDLDVVASIEDDLVAQDI